VDDADGEEFDFEYEDGDEAVGEDDDIEVRLQNAYYTAKGQMESEADEALAGFARVIELQKESDGNDAGQGIYSFKSLKQTFKLLFRLGRATMLDVYRSLLAHMKSSAVTRNYSEKVLNAILDFVSADASRFEATAAAAAAAATTTAEGAAPNVLQQIYELTLATLVDTKNDRLWFKVGAAGARVRALARLPPRLADQLEARKTCL
jgi:COP9 signalosome complex subunit 2